MKFFHWRSRGLHFDVANYQVTSNPELLATLPNMGTENSNNTTISNPEVPGQDETNSSMNGNSRAPTENLSVPEDEADPMSLDQGNIQTAITYICVLNNFTNTHRPWGCWISISFFFFVLCYDAFDSAEVISFWFLLIPKMKMMMLDDKTLVETGLWSRNGNLTSRAIERD